MATKVVVGVLSALIAALMTVVVYERGVGSGLLKASAEADGASYLDFVAVMLTGVTIVMTAVAVIISIGAFFTFSHFSKLAATAAQETKKQVERAIADAEKQLDAKVKSVVNDGLQDAVEKQIDAMGEKGGALETIIANTIYRGTDLSDEELLTDGSKQ